MATGIARSKDEGDPYECTCIVNSVVNTQAARFFCLMSFELLPWTSQNNKNAEGLPESHAIM